MYQVRYIQSRHTMVDQVRFINTQETIQIYNARSPVAGLFPIRTIAKKGYM